MQVWAHRGVSAKAPENTMAAFAMALETQVVGIELDVHLSADGHLIVCHDETIDRTSSGAGAIAEMTLEELRAFDFSQVEGKDFASFSPCPVSTLSEVLALVAPTDKWVNIELKTDKNPYPGIEEAVLACVRETGMADRVVVSSFNRESVARWRALGSGIPGCYLFYKPVGGLLRAIRKGEWDGIHPRYSLCPKFLVRAAHKVGLPVRVYTVDDERLAKRLTKRGVDDIFSNDPERMLQALAN